LFHIQNTKYLLGGLFSKQLVVVAVVLSRLRLVFKGSFYWFFNEHWQSL